jgi:hypothetical protein
VKKHPILFAGLALLVALPALGAVTQRLRPPREAAIATRSIIYDLAVETSPSVRKARERCQPYCGDESGGIEVAIGLLGIGGRTTTQSLLNLLSVRLDAGAAEERECQIAKRGKALVPALKALTAVQASNWCQHTFRDLQKQELADLRDVTVEQVCRPRGEVDADRKEWIAALQSGRDLFAESGPC